MRVTGDSRCHTCPSPNLPHLNAHPAKHQSSLSLSPFIHFIIVTFLFYPHPLPFLCNSSFFTPLLLLLLLPVDVPNECTFSLPHRNTEIVVVVVFVPFLSCVLRLKKEVCVCECVWCHERSVNVLFCLLLFLCYFFLVEIILVLF